ncbi:MAG: hypothetical protein ACFE9L_19320 [Candidatus Hodarchaeota archaeon]
MQIAKILSTMEHRPVYVRHMNLAELILNLVERKTKEPIVNKIISELEGIIEESGPRDLCEDFLDILCNEVRENEELQRSIYEDEKKLITSLIEAIDCQSKDENDKLELQKFHEGITAEILKIAYGETIAIPEETKTILKRINNFLTQYNLLIVVIFLLLIIMDLICYYEIINQNLQALIPIILGEIALIITLPSAILGYYTIKERTVRNQSSK